MATLTKDAIIDAVGSMSVLEVSELVKAMEEKFGVSASAVAAVAAPAMAAGGAADEASAEDEADKTVSIIIKETDASKKIPIIKEVRAITGIGLKDAKDLVETPGSTVKEDVSIDEANKIKKQLEAAGATVELK